MRDLHVSVSQVRSYLRCPRQFELTRVRSVEPAFTPVALPFGSSIHEALAHFYREHMEGRVPTFEQMVDVFAAAWQRASRGIIPLRFDEDESWESLMQKGKDMLGAFVSAQREPPVVEAVELAFEVDFHDPVTGEVLEETLVGAIDTVVREGDRLVLLEHKTSARKYSADQLRYDVQPSAYKLAARQLGMGEVGLRYQIITKAAKPAVQLADVERNERDEADFVETAAGVLRSIDAGAFFPIRGWQCRTCPVAYRCK